MSTNPIFIVTGADIEPKRERYIEYMICLHKIFSYTLPVYGVLSEYDSSDTTNTLPFSQFPFQTVKYIEKGILDNFNKSPREFISIKSLLEDMKSLNIDDSTFVIKASGRYLLLNDTFVDLVKASHENPNINSIVRLSDNYTQQYTFLYALRYKYFKEFYEQGLHTVPNGKNIEMATLEFLYMRGLFETTLKLDKLGVLTNINSEGNFMIF